MSTMAGACPEERRRGGGVRQYNRSETPRIRWTEELHGRFIQAVDALGGEKEATPKQILRVMGVKGVSISHVKSHLQVYRITGNQAKLGNRPSREMYGTSSKKRKRITQHHSSFYRPTVEEDVLPEFNLSNSTIFHPNTEFIQTDMLNQDNEPGYFDHQVGSSTVEEMNRTELTVSSKKLTAGREESERVSSTDHTDTDHPSMPNGDASSNIGGIWPRDCIAVIHNLNLELTLSSPSCYLIL